MKKQEKPECPRVCAFCEHATSLQTDGQMLCARRGIVEGGYVCRRFRYDPLKRNPRPSAPLLSFSDEDFDF